MEYSYYFKNTHYFRKMIHHKYLKEDRETYLNYRRSLRLCMDDDFYNFLVNNKQELAKILKFINKKLTRFLKESGEKNLNVTEITNYINQVTEEYRERAVIENSILEDKRLNSIEIIDENGAIQRGFQLQALSVKFKELDELYKNLEVAEYKDKIRESAIEIIKRSDISLEDIIKQVSTDYLQKFYEMTVKSERDVLKNDLKIYIKRNLEQFFPLIASHITEDSVKVEEAHYQYTLLVSENPVQKNYMKFIRNNAIRSQASVSIDNKTQEQMMADIINALKKEEEEKSLATSLEVDSLVQRYMDYRDSSETVKKRQALSFTFLKDFLKGNETSKHPAITIEEITEEDVKRFAKLFSNATPKSSKTTRDMTLFELVDYRVKNGLDMYKDNTLEMMQYDIQNFWKYVCKYINNSLNPVLFDAFDVLYLTLQAKHKDKKADIKLRGFTVEELQTFIDVVYAESKVKKILIDSPRNFYCFFFAYCLGTRIAEFTYVRTTDVKKQVKDGETAYYIYLNEDVAPQSLKNKNAHRNIPIPNILIELGFLNYLNHRIRREKEWLWDFPSSGYGAISVFFQRHIKNNFPEEKAELQLRSLRKNFASKVFSEEYNFEEVEVESIKSLEQNLKRLMGHSEGSATGLYLDRIEPLSGKKLLDSLEDYDLDLERLKNDVRSHYKTIITDLDNVDDSFNWLKKSTVKPKKGRRV